MARNPDLQEGLRDGSNARYRQYRRAVLILSCAFLAIFAGYNVAQGLQSSLNGELGFIKLGALYSTFTLCCIGAPPLIQRLESRGFGARWMLFAAGTVYALMVLANMFPVPAEGAPGYATAAALGVFVSVLTGAAAPVLWTVQNVYVARCAMQASQCSDDGTDDAGRFARTSSAFNGLFFTFVQFSGAVGTALSSAVTFFDPGSSRSSLFAVLGAVTLMGSVLCLLLPKLPRSSGWEEDGDQEQAKCSQTLALLREGRMSLMVPLIFTNGCFLAFVFGDYPKSYASAVIGPSYAAVVLFIFYSCNGIASAAWGLLISRGTMQLRTVLAAATIMQVSALLLLLAASLGWLPLFRQHYDFIPGESDIHKAWVLNGSGEPLWWEYLAPLLCMALVAVGGAAFESQPPVVLQTYFQDGRVVAAMANYKLWQSLGFAASFILDAVVSDLEVRVMALLLLFVVSFVSLLWLDCRVARLPGGSETQ